MRKEATLSLLKAEVHTAQERPANEGDLVHDEQLHILPLLFQATELLAVEFLFPSRIGKELETGGGRLSTEADVECGDACVRSQFDCRIDGFLLE